MSTKRKLVTRADHDRLFFTRWVLFLLVANEAAGLPQVSRQRLHSLLFMSFASSRYYAIDPLRQRARRTPQGPYYRHAHVALGGLVLGGMVSVDDFRAHPALRDLQFEGVFRPTLRGLEVARIMRETVTGARLYQFLLDMCLASARTTTSYRTGAEVAEEASIAHGDAALDKILEADLTYRRAVKRYSDTLELQESPGEPTPTFEGLSTIEQRLEQQGPYNRKDVFAAYQTLLMRRSERVA